MEIERLSTVLPVEDLQEAVSAWSALLGLSPAFVDGDRWAQFDVAGGRLALAGADRLSDASAVMLKVVDLDRAAAAAERDGLEVGPIEDGPHERRCLVRGMPGGDVMLYAARR